jgi:hypothetical protein
MFKTIRPRKEGKAGPVRVRQGHKFRKEMLPKKKNNNKINKLKFHNKIKSVCIA